MKNIAKSVMSAIDKKFLSTKAKISRGKSDINVKKIGVL